MWGLRRDFWSSPSLVLTLCFLDPWDGRSWGCSMETLLPQVEEKFLRADTS